jgi:hypothetical protein
LLENHESHISISLINKAREAGILLLMIPPHTSHKLQSLDQTMYDWIDPPGNAGKPVTIYSGTPI